MKGFHALAGVALLSVALSSQAELIYGITVPGNGTNLISFDSATPAALTTIGPISGINAGHVLRGIDFRPATGQLYALSSDSANAASAQLYTIDLTTGQATAVGGAIALTGNTSTRISLDFNPVTDRLRVVTGAGQSYRLNADTGAVTQDTSITNANGSTPLISGIAYTNNVAGATNTTLYAYDFLLDLLGTIGGLNSVPSPNGGSFNVIGASGIVTGDAGLGFDISGLTGIGYISVDDFNGSAGFAAEFFSVNLATGVLSQIGGDDFGPVLDISVASQDRGTVPEPGTLALALLALGALGAVQRRHGRH